MSGITSVPKAALVFEGNDDTWNLANHMDADNDDEITIKEFADVKRSGSGAIYANDIQLMEAEFISRLPPGTDVSEITSIKHKSPRRIQDEESLAGRIIWRAMDMWDTGKLGDKIASIPLAVLSVPVVMLEALAAKIKSVFS